MHGGGGVSIPVSIDASFIEIEEGETGPAVGNLDWSWQYAYLVNGAPAAPTITWARSHANAGIFLELVVPAGGGSSIVPILSHDYSSFTGGLS